MGKKAFVIGTIAFVASIIRYVSRESPYLVYIVAGINVTALVYVVFTVLEKTEQGIIGKIEAASLPKQISERECKTVRRRFQILSGSTLVLFLWSYFKIFCSDLGNDIISILALGLSAMDDEVSGIAADFYEIRRK